MIYDDDTGNIDMNRITHEIKKAIDKITKHNSRCSPQHG